MRKHCRDPPNVPCSEERSRALTVALTGALTEALTGALTRALTAALTAALIGALTGALTAAQFVAGGHKSEEIRTFFKVFCLYYSAAVKRFQKLSNRLAVASKTIQWGKTIEWVTF